MNVENEVHLFNAAVVGENPDSAFIVEGDRLHAVDQRVADLKKDKSNPKQVLPLMKEGLKALAKFAKGKVEPHFVNIDFAAISGQPNERALLIGKIENIFLHLPHNERNKLSSLIHHRQAAI